MAQQQININLPSIGSSGLNTEASPVTQDYSFASVADNAIIDSFGRIAARLAFRTDTETLPTLAPIASAVTYNLIIDVVEGGSINGASSVICTARNVGLDAGGAEVGTDYYIFERTGNSMTEVAYPALLDPSTLQTAHIVVTDDRFYIFSSSNETLIWDGSTVTLISAQAGYIGIQNGVAGPQVAPTFDRGMAAFGRIWASGHEGDPNTIYYSDLLLGASNYTVDGIDPLSTAGKINVLENWPNGKDSITAIAAHNNKIIVFGSEAILVFSAGYGDPADPASGFTLEDTITNVGCVSKYSLVNIGSDILFVDETGVRSLGRTIQERSSPMGNLTNNIRRVFSDSVQNTNNTSTIKMVHDHSNNIVLVLFSEQGLSYCLDMKAYRSAGLAKVTRWTGCYFNDMAYIDANAAPLLILGGTANKGYLRYAGYSSAVDSYILKWYSQDLNFGEPTRTKLVKQIDYTIVSSAALGSAQAKWAYDYGQANKSKGLSLTATPADYYAESEYTEAQYGGSEAVIKRYKVNTGGSGETIKIGLEAIIDGNGCSLQEINIQTLIGRIN